MERKLDWAIRFGVTLSVFKPFRVNWIPLGCKTFTSTRAKSIPSTTEPSIIIGIKCIKEHFILICFQAIISVSLVFADWSQEAVARGSILISTLITRTRAALANETLRAILNLIISARNELLLLTRSNALSPRCKLRNQHWSVPASLSHWMRMRWAMSIKVIKVFEHECK